MLIASDTATRTATPLALVGIGKIDRVINTPGTNPTATVSDDANVIRTIGGTVDTSFSLTSGIVGAEVAYQSMNLLVATIDSDGTVTRINNGVADIRAVVNGREHHRLNRFGVSLVGSATVDEFVSWASGSLAKQMTDNVDAAISGKTPSASTLDIFSAVDHVTASYVRNSNLWAFSLAAKLTGICVWGEDWGQANCLTAITPWHLSGAAHYGWSGIGKSVRFVEIDGTVRTVFIASSYVIPGTDIRIYKLTAALPAGIVPLKVLPADLGYFLRNPQFGIPVAFRNQFGELRIADIVLFDNISVNPNAPPTGSPRNVWNRAPVSGDSGSAVFSVIGTDLALVTALTSASSGPAFHAVNWPAAIAAVDGASPTGATVSVVDLSAYTNFNLPTYLRPDGTSQYRRPDGTSTYNRP